MARLPALIDALTLADGRPRGSIEHVSRGLREAELIQPTKRGRGATEMTARDAAALLLGVYGLADASPAAMDQARMLADLPQRRLVRPEAPSKRQALPSVLRPLAAAPTLLDGVAALIELAPLIQASSGRRTIASREAGLGAGILLERPKLYGSVSVNWGSADAAERQGLTIMYGTSGQPKGAEAYMVTTRVLHPVLVTLHGALFPEAASAPAAQPDRR